MMLQPAEALTALVCVPVSLYGWCRGCDFRWCVLLAGTGGGSFSWHAWGVLRWGMATDECTGGRYPSKVNPHPWLMTLDAILTTMLVSHMVALAIRPSSLAMSFLLVLLNESLLVTTVIVISTQERGEERYDIWLAVLIFMWVSLLFVHHTKRDQASAATWALVLAAGGCKVSELLLRDASWFRSALHAAWHVFSALASLHAVLLCEGKPPPSCYKTVLSDIVKEEATEVELE